MDDKNNQEIKDLSAEIEELKKKLQEKLSKLEEKKAEALEDPRFLEHLKKLSEEYKNQSDNNAKNEDEFLKQLDDAAKIASDAQMPQELVASEVIDTPSLEDTNDLAQTPYGKDAPEKVCLIPTFGRPVMPAQIAPVQITTEWEDTIVKIASSDEKLFALFFLGDKVRPLESIDVDSYPKTGTLVRLLHEKSINNEIQIIVEGIRRVTIKEILQDKSAPFVLVNYPKTIFPQSDSKEDIEIRGYAMSLVGAIHELLPLNPMFSEEMRQYLMRFDTSDPETLSDIALGISTTNYKNLQKFLDNDSLLERIKIAIATIKKELSAAKLQSKIKLTVSEKLSKRQHDFFLREQLNEIQKQLGNRVDDRLAEAEEFKKRMKKLNPPSYIKERFESEIKKIQVLEAGSPEYAVTRNYLDVLTTIPWGKTAKEDIDLQKAREILDSEHEGLKDVKDRIIEFLAVGSLKGGTRGDIMLFVGPPGVGKTSIGKSIAKALNRPFFRLSLGGVDDESVIKGHRKTYIGAMPGKMVQALRESKVINPVIMLDEIDKLSHSYQGDPASALLETLDPEQNNGFLDNYLDEKLDLSECLFICTANTTETIPEPLLDRMDPIRLSGYITKEKLEIAKKHLVPRGLKEAHIRKNQLKLSDSVLVKMIEEYARESGMRSTERAIDRIIRKAAVKIVNGEKSVTVTCDNLEDFLGTAPFKKEKHIEGVGVITGLAWTSVGGATLPVESSCTSKDSKGFELTGNLGKVMQESAKIAYSYIQANIARFKKEKEDFFKKASIHIHVPEGAIPKDGPSAGVTLASSLLSLALNKAPKKGFAMTGELSLTGQVLAIGGIREKTIAARRMGIFNIICPKANEGDVKELPKEVTDGVTFYFADTYDDVAKILFDNLDNL